MYIFITILIIIICVFLILSVLVQNPKGGGLSAGFGGVGNQVMGARKATDFIEKTTWTLVIALLVLSLASGLFMPRMGEAEVQKSEIEDRINDNSLPFIPDAGGVPSFEDEPAKEESQE